MTVIICPNIGTETKMRIAKTEIKGIAIHSHLIPAMELGGIKVDENYIPSGNVTLYAKWNLFDGWFFENKDTYTTKGDI